MRFASESPRGPLFALAILAVKGVRAADDDDAYPTLTDSGSIPTYPAAAVPPTENAPFMHHSHAPDGTVFIAVGAILGLMLLGVLLWRLIVGLLLHRNVRRAAMAQHIDHDLKNAGLAPPAPFYKYTDQGSNSSFNGGAANGGNSPGGTMGRGARRTTRGPVHSTASQSNLFFSPTAAAPSGNTLAGNRTSTFLPSGFYAAGSASANNSNAISLSNLRPDSRGGGSGGAPTSRITPPDSPSFPPTRRDSPALSARRDMSTSSVNLSNPLPSGQRAPSAYLDDLLADDPSALPPPQMPPSAGSRPNRI